MQIIQMSRTALFIDWNNLPQLQDKEFVGEMTYDALNRPVTVTQPDSTVVTNIYDKGGLLKQVLHNSTQHIANITYNPRGQRENIYYGNNTKTRYYYNPLNFRLTRILTTRNNGQDILQDLNYSYDAVGNITSQTDNAQQTFYFNNQVIAPTGSYQYDALYRLLQATGRELLSLGMPTHDDFVNNIPCPDTATNAMQNYTQHYQYDALGNMLQMQSVGNWTRNFEYNNPMNNNYLLGHGNGTVYSYDAHGNMLTMPHLSSMSYDYQDQLIRAGNGIFVSYYNYDAAGTRTRKVVVKNNIIETRYYINGYEVYRKEVNGVVEVERKTINISDDEKVFVRIETKTGENPVIRYQYDNHLGSACLELDDSGQIISYEEYHPFGTTSYRSGRTETEVSLKRYKYCGKERDEETGLYYYGMRYYAAWLCRFVSVDPLQFKYPYYTPYQYAGNKPISYIDLDGGEEKKPEKQSNYVVQKGDTPSSIAEKAGISIWDLAKWNQGQQEGGGYFSNIGKGDYQEYWVKGKGTSWSIKPGDVLNIVGGKESTSTTNASVGKFKGAIYPKGYPDGGGIYSVGLFDPFIDMATERISGVLQKMGMGEKTADITAGIALLAGSFFLSKKIPSLRSNVAKMETSLVKTETQFSKHSLERLAQRGVTQDMAELAISKGQKFYDPLNKSVNYVLPDGFGSGKSLLVGTNPLTGEVTTVIRSSKNLINSRFIPIP